MATTSFQSHNGAIAARVCFVQISSMPRFNPTMVRLLPYRATGIGRQYLRFNPTMVRLLLGRLPQGNGRGIRFNPTMVRLLHDDEVYACET